MVNTLWYMFGSNQVTGAYTLSQIQNLIVMIAVFADSILEFFLLLYIFYYVTNRFDVALIGAMIPTSIYSYFVSNPLKEYATAKANVEHFFYFMHRREQEDMIHSALRER